MGSIGERMSPLSLAQRLISFNTINPPGQERACAEYLGLILEAKPETTGPTDDVSGNTRLFTVAVPEGKWTELAGKEGTNYYISWSPDGQWITYNSEGWIRTRAAGIIWEVEVDEFLRKATDKKSLSKAGVVTSANYVISHAESVE